MKDFLQSYWFIGGVILFVITLLRSKQASPDVPDDQPLIVLNPSQPTPPTSQAAFDALHVVDRRLEHLGYPELQRKDLRDAYTLLLMSPARENETDV